MFLPCIFEEHMADAGPVRKQEKDEEAIAEGIVIDENDKMFPSRYLAREFSTLSFTGPPPLQKQQSVVLPTLAIAESNNKTKSFWGKLLLYV